MIGLCAALGSIGLSPVASSRAEAAEWFRGGGSLCMPTNAYNSPVPVANGWRGSGGIGGGQFVCPLYERDGLHRNQLSDVHMWVTDNDPADSMQAQLCRRAHDSSSGFCTGVASSGDSFTGLFRFGIDSVWSGWSTWRSSTGGMAYLYVRVTGDATAGNRSFIHGYMMGDSI